MRKLTGKWFLKRTFFGNFKLMVEVDESFSRSFIAEICPDGHHRVWQKARPEDIVQLDIKIF